MDASREQFDRVDRARLVESGGARDDSLSWHLSRAKQGDAIPSRQHEFTVSKAGVQVWVLQSRVQQ